MKVGKHINLKEYENIRLSYGTVDQKNLKSIYLEMESWLEPKNDVDYDSIIFKSRRKIKDRLRNEKTDLFKKECIVDFDIKTNSIKEGKRSFMNAQITLFTNKDFNIKSKEISHYVQNLLENIIINDLTDKNLFIFHKTKK